MIPQYSLRLFANLIKFSLLLLVHLKAFVFAEKWRKISEEEFALSLVGITIHVGNVERVTRLEHMRIFQIFNINFISNGRFLSVIDGGVRRPYRNNKKSFSCSCDILKLFVFVKRFSQIFLSHKEAYTWASLNLRIFSFLFWKIVSESKCEPSRIITCLDAVLKTTRIALFIDGHSSSLQIPPSTKPNPRICSLNNERWRWILIRCLLMFKDMSHELFIAAFFTSVCLNSLTFHDH